MRVSFNALTLLCTMLLLAASIRASAAFDELRYREAVEYLSSDELEGRMSGTPGGEKAAHYIAELNAIHPFREGNGRCQLTLLNSLLDLSGYEMDEGKIAPDGFMAAMIASFHGDNAALTRAILDMMS